MGRLAVLFVGLVVGCTVLIWLLGDFTVLMDAGLFDFINNGFDSFGLLFGSSMTTLFVSLFGVAGLVLCVRFIMSWLGENAGHTANK